MRSPASGADPSAVGSSLVRARTRHTSAQALPETLGGASAGTGSAKPPSERGGTLATVNSSVDGGGGLDAHEVDRPDRAAAA